MMFRVISWNILNDNKVPKHLTQKDRLDGVVNTIKNYLTKQPTIIFLFEVEDKEAFRNIASKLKFQHFESIKYVDHYLGYISNVPLDSVDYIRHREGRILPQANNNRKSMLVHYKGTSICAVHMPFHPVFHIPARIGCTVDIITSEKKYKKRIIVGDLNAFITMPSRLLLWVFGFKYVFASSSKKDKFPSSSYKGRTVPKHFPKASIDAHYKKYVQDMHHYRENTEFSDHPILVSDFIIQSK